MKGTNVYIAIGCNGKDDMSRGLRLAKWMLKDNISLDAVHTRESYLAQTGWHENSHKYVLAGTDADVFYPIKTQLYGFFDDILKEAYEVEDTSDIIFDDESLDDYLLDTMTRMKNVYPSLTLLDEEDLIYRLTI